MTSEFDTIIEDAMVRYRHVLDALAACNVGEPHFISYVQRQWGEVCEPDGKGQ